VNYVAPQGVEALRLRGEVVDMFSLASSPDIGFSASGPRVFLSAALADRLDRGELGRTAPPVLRRALTALRSQGQGWTTRWMAVEVPGGGRPGDCRRVPALTVRNCPALEDGLSFVVVGLRSEPVPPWWPAEE